MSSLSGADTPSPPTAGSGTPSKTQHFRPFVDVARGIQRVAGTPACWQPSQVHAGPQLQASPHWHAPVGWAAAVWQPHVHSFPVQVPQAHTFD